MRALAEEFLLRHLDDGAIGGFLLGLYFATVLFTLDALCRWVWGGHREDLTTWGSREAEKQGKVEKSKRSKSAKLRKSRPHLLLHVESLDFRLSTFLSSCLLVLDICTC